MTHVTNNSLSAGIGTSGKNTNTLSSRTNNGKKQETKNVSMPRGSTSNVSLTPKATPSSAAARVNPPGELQGSYTNKAHPSGKNQPSTSADSANLPATSSAQVTAKSNAPPLSTSNLAPSAALKPPPLSYSSSTVAETAMAASTSKPLNPNMTLFPVNNRETATESNQIKGKAKAVEIEEVKDEEAHWRTPSRFESITTGLHGAR
ncbi:hypothetical protein ARMSODRAFT_982380 [Armillaria solidipes]|uniref:Uncharacterized protein n=1 Tax=Armillaria solidipes TaxID=1076256 RepID=A0A2H3ANG8_9AGAR|nr:hypothetical protein ARMSODRAFT_982380 [Armillaria solidipes]